MVKVGDVVILNQHYYNLWDSTLEHHKNIFEIVEVYESGCIRINSINVNNQKSEILHSDYVELDIQYTRKQKLKKLLECSK